MTRRVLSDRFCKAVAPAAPGGRNYHWDALTPSLALRVTERGHRSWIVQRRVNGRLKLLTLGDFPALSLKDAREKAESALKDMERGKDPAQVAKVKAGLRRTDSFEGAVETYIKREVEKNRRPRTAKEIIRPLRGTFIPKWGSLPLSDIAPRDVIEALDEIVDSGAPIQANRTRSILHRFFRWAVERQLVETNPVAAVRKPSKETTRARVLSDDELREVWLHSETLGWPFGPYFRALILTGQRRNEVAGMSWAEINSADQLWVIPGERTKNGRSHVVPIAKPLRSILDAAPRFDEDKNKTSLPRVDRDKTGPVFTGHGKVPVSGFSDAKEKLDELIFEARKTSAAPGDKIEPPAPWTLHDLRRSCATGMGRIGVAPHVIEAALNHSSGFRAGIAGVYQRQEYLEERRAAFELWAGHVVSLAAPRRPEPKAVPRRLEGKIIQLRKRSSDA